MVKILLMKSNVKSVGDKDFEIRTPFLGVGDPLATMEAWMTYFCTFIQQLTQC